MCLVQNVAQFLIRTHSALLLSCNFFHALQTSLLSLCPYSSYFSFLPFIYQHAPFLLSLPVFLPLLLGFTFSQQCVVVHLLSQIVPTPHLHHFPPESSPAAWQPWAQHTCAAAAGLQSTDTCHFFFCLSWSTIQLRWWNVMGAAGESESPDSHPGRSIPESSLILCLEGYPGYRGCWGHLGLTDTQWFKWWNLGHALHLFLAWQRPTGFSHLILESGEQQNAGRRLHFSLFAVNQN